ncbi:SagB/ThcOx family dehydrogenase [Odoribacter sp. OttesenSCG-928-L07]|nr:SagB/ThcOx family dehydrogenase [Odoribacter sp. OttesenSCG-928-L07]MDL2241026.1 SagB/ThcOx family dehydrogenase [Bacteroidales bacterium OttesenSCG-928-K22]
MKKFFLPIIIIAMALTSCNCNQNVKDDTIALKETYTPEKTEPMELKKFENIKLLTPNIESGDALMKCMQNRKSYREFEDKNLSLKHLSELLWVTNGLNRPTDNRKTVPSALALYPLDTYVILANGIYLYNPQNHELETILEGDYRELAGLQDFVKTAPLNIILIANYDVYKERQIPADKHLYLAALDAGHCTQNIYLYCASEGLKSVVRGGAKDKELLETLGLGDNHQFVLAHSIGY